MEKKYRLIASGGNYRIRAIKDFGKVKEGQYGGIVSGEHNLSQDGTCWIDFDSSVTDNAQVKDNAQVTKGSKLIDNAKVYGNAEIICSTLRNYVEVYDNAVIKHSIVSEKSKVYGGAIVKLAELSDCSKIYESAVITGSKTERVTITDLAEIHNNSIVSSGSLIKDSAEICEYATINHSVIGDTVRVGGDSSVEYSTLKENVSVDGSTRLYFVNIDGKAHITDGYVSGTNSIVVILGLPIGEITIYSGFKNGEHCVLTNSRVGVKTITEFHTYLKEMNTDTAIMECLLNCADIVMENATRK